MENSERNKIYIRIKSIESNQFDKNWSKIRLKQIRMFSFMEIEIFFYNTDVSDYYSHHFFFK